jgi:carboxyl-terminal processing protease
MINHKKTSFYVLILLLVFGSVGFIINQSLFADYEQFSRKHWDKIRRVVELVNYYYVEDVEWDDAVEGAVVGMLNRLDPHSVYIEPQKVERNKEDFSGKYEGIGIEFEVINGYITVITPIAGSPAEQVGLHSGDRIVKIDGKSAIGIDRDDVPKKLKGPKGTKVNVTIVRDGVDEPFDVIITRDVIPISTVTTKFMADDSTGYVWVNRFAATTSIETEQAIQDLLNEGMKRLILDLRGNPGGYLHEAVKVAGKFLPGHQLIVETRGKNERIDDKFYSDQWQENEKSYTFPLIVMIDKGSASASEIVAGAIQDYDRGLILGTNSFGKGLVQKEFTLNDGSAVRITTAKYFTPSGRLIQRDYKGKNVNDYYAELADTAWVSEDSLENRPQYQTRAGRLVYGGGGIRPDIIIQYESYSKSPKLINQMFSKRLFFEFANKYDTKNKNFKGGFKNFAKEFEVTYLILEEFKSFCIEQGINIDESAFQKDQHYISARIKAEIARHFWDKDGFYYVWLSQDNQFLTALKSFKEAKRIALLSKSESVKDERNY